MDGRFIDAISRFIGQVDDLKCAAPVLATAGEAPGSRPGDQGRFPEEMSTVEDVTDLLTGYCQGMTVWAHPNAQVNVIPPSTISSIMAFLAAAIYNPNMMWDEYSARFALAEIGATAAISDLVGYDPDKSGGLFTFGGTGTILYACKIGVEKATGGRAMADGVGGDLKIVASNSTHYSKLSVAGWLGVGTRNLINVPTTSANEISLPDLECHLRRAFQSGTKVAAIIATMGTTDAFGIDDLRSIVKIRDELAQDYGLEHPPHIHADAVIGWAWSAFRDYDFDANALEFHERTLGALKETIGKIGSLHMADSIGIDFHKTGYAPYVSSLFLVKDRQDLSLLSRAPEQMPYVYQYGNYHPGIYSLETSRTGTGALAAMANISLLGKKGYRVLIGHVVEMGEMLRQRLEAHDFIKVLNDQNHGPVTLFRIYPEGVNAREVYQREVEDPSLRDELLKVNAYNRRIFNITHERAMRGEGVLLSWTDAYRYAKYPEGQPIAAVKSFIMSPWTDLSAVDMVVRQVLEAREMTKSDG
jgi:glutamate/tyrosine decarboxylase-like PLP-dependent enzyme